MLIHLVSFENGADMMKTYKTIRKELEQFDESLAEKEEIVLLTKTDVTDAKTVAKKITEFKKISRGKKVYAISLFDDASIKEFKDELIKILRKK